MGALNSSFQSGSLTARNTAAEIATGRRGRIVTTGNGAACAQVAVPVIALSSWVVVGIPAGGRALERVRGKTRGRSRSQFGRVEGWELNLRWVRASLRLHSRGASLFLVKLMVGASAGCTLRAWG